MKSWLFATVTALPALLVASPTVAQPLAVRTENTQAAPLAGSCLPLARPTSDAGSEPSGFYWIRLRQNPNVDVVMYCNNRVAYNGLRGGWTLVWSNLRGGRGKLTSDMHWGASIETLPRYRGASALGAQSGDGPGFGDLQSFEVYTGLRWWHGMIYNGGRREMLYDWAHNYGDQGQLDRRAACRFELNQPADWTITFPSTCERLIGTELPELFTYHNGQRWSTVDADNDNHTTNCAARYSGSPWWYNGCWRGSISGGGESQGDGINNGAYWRDNNPGWGRADGMGAGNGWIYIR
jgi:hypothetical protein